MRFLAGVVVMILLLAVSGLALKALGEGAAVPETESQTTRPPATTLPGTIAGPAPKAVLVGGRHDFGTIELGETGQHWFTIRNDGDAELLLKPGPATCGCMSGELSDTHLLPGDETRVCVTWTPPRAADRFVQGVKLYTNDPKTSSLALDVMGSVRQTLAAEPASVVFTEVHPEDGRSASVVLHSSVWLNFEETAIVPSDDWFEVAAEPLTPGELAQRGIETGKRLRFTVSPNAAPGWHRGHVIVTAQCSFADGARQERQIEIPVEATIAADVTLAGNGYDGNQTWRLGNIAHGQSLRRTLLVLVRGRHRDVAVESIDIEPEHLQVDIEKKLATDRLTQYQLHLTVPDSAPEAVYSGSGAARISIDTDHPQQPQWDLRVEFAIVPME